MCVCMCVRVCMFAVCVCVCVCVHMCDSETDLPSSRLTGCLHHLCQSTLSSKEHVKMVKTCLHGGCHFAFHMAKLRVSIVDLKLIKPA